MNNSPNQVVVITGASKGIGRATAELFVNQGYKVFGLARHLTTEKLPFELLVCDVTNREEVESTINKIQNDCGRIDILVNNAGMGVSGATEYISDDKVNSILSVNIKGVINCTRAVIPYLKKTKGKIINLSSVAAALEIPFQSYYSATKSFVWSYSKALRIELKPFKIGVTTVLPGDTKTSFTENREKVEAYEGYENRVANSVSRMEKDEQDGMPPIKVAKVILKVAKRKNPPVSVTVGFVYNLFMFIKRILPERMINWILYFMYGK